MAKIYEFKKDLSEALFEAWVDDDFTYAERVAKKLREQLQGEQAAEVDCWLNVLKATRRAYPGNLLSEYCEIHPMLPSIMKKKVDTYSDNVFPFIIQKLMTTHEETMKTAVI